MIVADWIASNEDVLPYLTGELPEVVEAPNRVRQAMRELGLPEPWRPAVVPGDVGELFASRFKLPSGARPRPVQHAVCEVVRAMSEPGLMIVEAPMGEGKTEAALAAAELLAEKWGAGGVLVALPTQATSDAMFTRVVDWLDAMGASGQQVGGAITLGHGKARFNRLFQGLMRPGRMEIADQAGTTAGHVVAAHAWLSGRKKASLANFMMGTIDQLLFVGLKARHVMLRHLGLAGKVVVLDEVHAFDAYMNSYLTRVLTWLGAYGVPVVALSATLPTQRRRELLEAYRRGVRFGPDGSKLALPEISSAVEGDIGYPVLSWSQGTQVQTRAVEASGRRVEVDVELLDGGVEDDLDAVVGVLRDVLDGGGCAVVVRNTVRRVLATAERLVQEFPGEVTVAHARFMTSDRMRTDEDLLGRFGSPSRASGRPHRHILVASQVIEQSLDVDFDVVITDLAPVDLVLQRLGRLHRHQRGEHQCERPEKLRVARAFITGLGVGGAEPELEPAASRYVYGAYPLLRSAAVLLPRFGDRIVLPDDIPTLVQQAYGDRDIEPESWHGVVAEARRVWRERTQDRRRKAGTFQIPEPGRPGRAIVGWLAADIGEADLDAQGQGQVRDGAPTLEAMLVIEGSDGRWRTPDWLPDGTGGCAIPRDDVPQDELARSLAACGLRLPLKFSSEQAETALWEATPPTWEYSPLIYRTPVLVIDEDGCGELAGRRLRYTQERGLEVFREA